MKLLWNKDRFSFRSCMNCGSWMNLRTYFCHLCHQTCIKQFSNPAVIYVENIAVKSLLRWPPGESDILSALVLQLKDDPAHAWAIWAEEFMIKWNIPDQSKKTILISSQSSSGKTHAQNWGNALSDLLKYSHICPLKPKNTRIKQKELGRNERSARSFDINVDFSTLGNKRIIFVDDVVTTGKTALAAYKALKKPTHFEVWCLIYREL